MISLDFKRQYYSAHVRGESSCFAANIRRNIEAELKGACFFFLIQNLPNRANKRIKRESSLTQSQG